jgi:hypothetical protein
MSDVANYQVEITGYFLGTRKFGTAPMTVEIRCMCHDTLMNAPTSFLPINYIVYNGAAN